MNNSNNNDNNKQNYNNNIQSQPLNQKQIKKQEEAEAAQDVAHTVGKGAATYYGGAVGNQLYDIASKTKLGKGIERNAGKMVMKNPLLKPAMKNLHKSGATKVANNIIDNLGSKKGSTPAMNKGAKSTNKDLGLASKNKMTLPSRNTQRVTPNFSEQQPDFSNMTEEEIEEYQNQQEELKRQQINREKQEKRKANAKSFIQFLKKHPHIALFLGFGIFLFVLLLILLYVFTADVDLVGTRGVSYNSADTVTGYCDHIILIKEHDSFTGKPVASIDDVDLEETFRLNNADVKRWQYKTIELEDYVKGVLQAEASIIKDEKTYEVASIVARTYAVEITSKNCYTWNNENKRDEYKNPQDYTSGKVDDDISSAVSTTTGLVAYDKDNIIDMSNNNYYDYFCYKEITNDKDEEKSYYRMSQENKEENLLIPVDWTKDDNNVADGNAKKWNYSGKYSGGIYTNDCQEDGLSLYGAKYLLNKKFDSYTTIRTLMYYYTYDLELKKIDTFVSNGCFYWPTDGTTITSRFGLRNAPTEGASTNHGAIDIGVPEGTNVYATSSGKVTVAGAVSGYGYAVYIDHGNGIVSRYGHLKAGGIKVSVGQQVTAGQVIALSGNTGISTGPHLHFEVRVNDVKVDPLNYVSPSNPTPTSCDANSITNSGIVNTGDNVKSVCLTLKKLGYSDNAVAAVLTNMSYENSKFDPTVRNKLKCLGIVQWCYNVKRDENGNQYSIPGTGRLGQLESLANYDTFEVQLNFMVNELISGGRYNIHQIMLAGGDVSNLTETYCNKFETPGESLCKTRGNDVFKQQSYIVFSKNNCS